MKMPAASRIQAADASVARDKEAKAALKAKGEPFTVPAFCAALAAILAREAGQPRKPFGPPWKGQATSLAGVTPINWPAEWPK